MRKHEKRCYNLDQQSNAQPDLELLKDKEGVIKKIKTENSHRKDIIIRFNYKL